MTNAREQIIAATTKLSKAQARTIVQATSTLTAREALKAGIVHAVKELKIPKGALILSA